MKNILSFIVTLLLTVFSIADAQTTFSKRFNINPKNPENGWDIAELSDGYLLLGPGGCQEDYNTACTNLIKVDYEGDTIWYRQYHYYPGGPDCLATYDDSLIYIGATTHVEDALVFDRQKLVTGYDRNGNQIWQKEWGDSSKHEWGGRVLATKSGRLFCAYRKEKVPNSNSESAYLAEIAMMNLQGELLWQKEYGRQWKYAGSPRLKETSDGNLVLAYAKHDSSSTNPSSFVLTKIDTTGEAFWSVIFTYISLFDFSPPSLTLLPDNVYVLSWGKEHPLSGELAPALKFVNDEGEEFNEYTFTTADNAIRELDFLNTCRNGDIIGGGTGWLKDNGVVGDWGGWVFRMSPEGELLWERSITIRMGPNQENAYGTLNNIIETSDGGLLAIGNADNILPTGEPETDMWVVKLDSLGCLEPGCGIRQIVLPTEEAIRLFQPDLKIWPNPASDNLTITFGDATKAMGMKISVLNSIGQSVREMQVGQVSGTVTLPVRGLPNGIYYLFLQNNSGGVVQRKFIVAH